MTEIHRDLIIGLAARFGLPSIHAFPDHPANGTLASYGVAVVDHFRPAAEYIHRILLGVKPSDLPVQAPTKFQLVINLKTARALRIEAANASRPSRRGDRVKLEFAAPAQASFWHNSEVPGSTTKVG